MLSSLLPGLRELRAPLAAGYVWLLGLWLALNPFLPPGGQATRLYREVVGLANWAGKPAVFAAATLAAYVLGTMSIAFTHNLDELVRRSTRLRWLKPSHRGSRRVRRALRDAAVNKLCSRFLDDESFRDAVMEHIRGLQVQAQRDGRDLPRVIDRVRIDHLRRQAMDDYLHRWHLLDTVVVLDAYVESAKEDLDYLAPRLLGKEDELYGEYDRLNAEGSFRVGLCLPVGFVLLVLALRLSPWWLFGMVVPLQLLYLGSASWAAAEKNLAVALAADRVESPTLERLLSADIEFLSYHELAPRVGSVPAGMIVPRRYRPQKPFGTVRVELPQRQAKPK